MADEAKIGTQWQGDELEAIVSDYFEMLAAELAGQSYVKLKHATGVMVQTGRTHGSVEYKYQNISAVLDKLGMPWISGYKPMRKYQAALFDAIDRFLSAHPEIPGFVPPKLRTMPVPDEVFVAPPALAAKEGEIPEGLHRLVKKFDPVERDHRNRALGSAGEQFVLHLERDLLVSADRSDLARKIRWVAAEDGDGAGYDILSFDSAGRERLLEVKTTNGSARTPFFLTRNECAVAAERPNDWRLYRVHLFAKGPRIFTVAPPLGETISLCPEVWRASFLR